MELNVENQFIFILNISLAVFIGGTVLSLTNDWVKRGLNRLIAWCWEHTREWWVMRNPPSLEVLSVARDGNEWTNKIYLNLNHYLGQQSSLPGTNLTIGIFPRGKHRRMLYGKKINLDLIDEEDLLGAGGNGMIMPGNPRRMRLLQEHPVSIGYEAVTCTLSLTPRNTFALRDFKFKYYVVGTKIQGVSILKISTASGN